MNLRERMKALRVKHLHSAYEKVFRDLYEEAMQGDHPGKTSYEIADGEIQKILAVARKTCWKEFP